jgi:hypothetical protein
MDVESLDQTQYPHVRALKEHLRGVVIHIQAHAMEGLLFLHTLSLRAECGDACM